MGKSERIKMIGVLKKWGKLRDQVPGSGGDNGIGRGNGREGRAGYG